MNIRTEQLLANNNNNDTNLRDKNQFVPSLIYCCPHISSRGDPLGLIRFRAAGMSRSQVSQGNATPEGRGRRGPI